MHVIFHRLAAAEYPSARDWYEERAGGLGEKFSSAVDKEAIRISTQTELLPKLGRVYRWMRVHRFP